MCNENKVLAITTRTSHYESSTTSGAGCILRRARANKGRARVDFAMYLQLHLRVAKALTMGGEAFDVRCAHWQWYEPGVFTHV